MDKVISEKLINDVIVVLGDAKHSNYSLSQVMGLVDMLKKLPNPEYTNADFDELNLELEKQLDKVSELEATIASMTAAGATKATSERGE